MVEAEKEAQAITVEVIVVVKNEEEAQVITMVEVITMVNKEDLLYLKALLKTS